MKSLRYDADLCDASVQCAIGRMISYWRYKMLMKYLFAPGGLHAASFNTWQQAKNAGSTPSHLPAATGPGFKLKTTAPSRTHFAADGLFYCQPTRISAFFAHIFAHARPLLASRFTQALLLKCRHALSNIILPLASCAG